jgi:hypothetical protein
MMVGALVFPLVCSQNLHSNTVFPKKYCVLFRVMQLFCSNRIWSVHASVERYKERERKRERGRERGWLTTIGMTLASAIRRFATCLTCVDMTRVIEQNT